VKNFVLDSRWAGDQTATVTIGGVTKESSPTEAEFCNDSDRD